MVLPIVLGLAGLAAAGSAGRTALGDWLQQREQEATATRYREALAGATGPTQYVEGPRMSPSDVGPQVPIAQPGELDMMALGRTLAEQGDPMGLQILSGQMGGADQFGRQVLLQQMRDQAAMERTLAGRTPAAAAPSMNVPGFGQVPVEPTAIGSKEWMELQREGAGLQRVRDVMEEFRDVMRTSGSESVGATAQKLRALRNEMIYALASTTEAGALGEQELEFFGERIPDPTRWTPEFMAQESGKLEAMADWFNSQVRGYQSRGRFTGELPPVRLFPSESMVPSDWRAVDESELSGTVAPPPPTQTETRSINQLLEMTDEDVRAAAAGVPSLPAQPTAPIAPPWLIPRQGM